MYPDELTLDKTVMTLTTSTMSGLSTGFGDQHLFKKQFIVLFPLLFNASVSFYWNSSAAASCAKYAALCDPFTTYLFLVKEWIVFIN